MIDSLLAALEARGQAPLAGYLARFLDEYALRCTPAGLGLSLAGLIAGLAWLRAAPPAMPWGPVLGRRLRLVAALLAAIFSAAFQAGVLGRIPREPDEATYLFEARLMLRGRAHAPDPGPELRELVELPFSAARDGRWIGAFPPGWPLLLGLGEALGGAWLLNPMLLALNLWLVGLWVERRVDSDTATLAVLLGAVSPFVLVLHGTLMADPLGLTLCLLCLLAAEGEDPKPTALAAAAAVAVRPAMAFFVAPQVLWVLVRLRSGRALGGAVLAGTPVVALLLAWNAAATGDPWVWPYGLAAPPYGFGPVSYSGLALRHDAVAGLVGTAMNAAALGVDLLGIAGLAWIPLVVGLPALVRAGGPALPACLGLWAGHFFYFHPGLAYGPRFALPALAPMLAAAALGLTALGSSVGRGEASGLPRLVAACLPAMLLHWWLPASVQLARHAGIDPRPLEVAEARRPHPARLLAFVPAVGYPDRPLDRCFLGRLDPWLEGPVVWLRDPGDPAARARIAARLGREPWLLPWP